MFRFSTPSTFCSKQAGRNHREKQQWKVYEPSIKTDVNAALDNSLAIRGPNKALLFHIVT